MNVSQWPVSLQELVKTQRDELINQACKELSDKLGFMPH
jgi:hypothetical protein